MKKIKDLHKYIIGFILGIVVIGSVSVYAVEAVINSKEVSYDNETSHGSYKDVQNSIDELYKRSGVMKQIWKDPILNGADPVFDDTEELIPVTIDDDGTVHYANLYTKWYEYETKRWANAVILNSTGKGKNYKTGDTIIEDDIESYFVWIPRYKYKIWDLGKYKTVQNVSGLKDTATDAAAGEETSFRRVTANARVIDIVFQKKEEKTTDKSGECKPDVTSGGGDNCHIGDYMTHPAFTLGEKELNGIWVGKFEVTGDINNISVKPGVQSVRNQTLGTFWHKLYDYKRNLDSHMMKNTEWGAVAYLSHSIYGIGREISINNNSNYLTGYSAAANTDQSAYFGIYGTSEDVTQPWNTSTGYLASTTGNITGVYDMSGGAYEYMAAYMDGYGVTSSKVINSDLTGSDLETYAKYFNKYSTSSDITSYDKRILGDATGEMGPFYQYYDKDGGQRYHNAWYADYSYFVDFTAPWFIRGGFYADGVLAGLFLSHRSSGGMRGDYGFRLILSAN